MKSETNLDKVFDQVMDICSSGMGGPLDENPWYEEQLTELFASLPPKEKKQLWEKLNYHIERSEGWFVSDIRFLKKLLGVR